MAKKSKPTESRLPALVWLAFQVTLCMQIVATCLYYNGHFTNPLIHKFLLGQHLILTGWFLLAIHACLRGSLAWSRSSFLLPGALLAGWALVRALVTDKADALENAFIFVCYLSAFPQWLMALQDKRFRSLTGMTIVFSAFIMMVGCIRQLLTDNPAFELPLLDMMTLAPGSYDRQKLGSFMGHNIQSGAVIAIGTLFAIFYLSRAKTLLARVTWSTYIAMGMALIVLGGTRGVILMLAPALLYLAVAIGKPLLMRNASVPNLSSRFMIRAAAGAAIVLVVISAVMGVWMAVSPKATWENTVFSRFVTSPETLFSGTYPRVWWMSVLMITDNPLFGVGMSAWPYQYPYYQEEWFANNPDTWIGLPKAGFHTMRAHNDYLHIWAELGLPAILLIGWMLVLFARLLGHRLRDPQRHAHHHAACAVAIAIATHATVFFTFHVATTGILFIASLALAAHSPGSMKPVAFPRWAFSGKSRIALAFIALGVYGLSLAPNLTYMRGDYMARLFVRYSQQAYDTYNPANQEVYLNLMSASYDSLQRATRISPNVGIYWYDLGKEAIFRGIGTNSSAVVRDGISYLERSLDSYSFYITFAELGKAHAWLWRTGGNEADWNRATEHYARAVSIMPTFFEGWTQIALLEARKGDALRSIELISELELRFPGFVETTIINQAKAAEQRGDPEDAMFLVSMASASQPANFNIFREAIEFYLRVQRIDLGADIYVNTVEFHQEPSQRDELIRLLTAILYDLMTQRRYAEAWQTVSQIQNHELLAQDGTFWVLNTAAAWLDERPWEAMAALHQSMEAGTAPETIEGLIHPLRQAFIQ